MKENNFYKISDKIFLAVTCLMIIFSVLSLIQYSLGYVGIVTEETIFYCSIMYGTPMVIFIGAITVSVQFLFIAARFKEIGYDEGNKFLITILILNIILEVPVVAFLCAFDLQFIFYLWVPIVLFAAEFTKKRFFKAEEK